MVIYKKLKINIFTFLGLFELISVPLILLKSSFSFLVIVISFLYLGIIYLIIRNREKFSIKKKIDKIEVIYLLCLALISVFLLIQEYNYQHVDEDDARFVVEVVDAIENDTMLLTNPATGEVIESYRNLEIAKDAVAAWPMFVAYLSKITTIKPAIMDHTILPLLLTILAIYVWWKFIENFVGKNIVYQSMFVIIMLLMMIFGYSHRWTMISMFMNRLWQGKAVVASVGIPALFTSIINFYDNKNNFLDILFVNLSMCLFSGNGIVMGAIILGCFSLIYGILKKDIKTTIILLCLTIPNGILYLIESSL